MKNESKNKKLVLNKSIIIGLKGGSSSEKFCHTDKNNGHCCTCSCVGEVEL